MSLPLKIGGAIGTLGIVGGSAGIIHHFTRETVKDRLIKAGYQVLNVDNDEGWQTILDAYNAIQEKNEIFEGSTLRQETKENLKKKCKLALSNNKDYALASRWCVKEQTLAEMLTSNKYTKLQASGTSETVKGQWKEKIKELEKIPVADRKIKVALTGDESTKISALEAFCTGLSIDSLKTHKDKEFEKKFNQAKEWCALKNKE